MNYEMNYRMFCEMCDAIKRPRPSLYDYLIARILTGNYR